MMPYQLVKFHPDVLSVPFHHRKELLAKFRDVLGLLNLDYVSIEIINPDDEYLFFSSLAAVNFNVIANHLWPYDGSLSPSFFKVHADYSWEKTYQANFHGQLKQIKQIEFGFVQGFCLVRKVKNFYLLYSFASKYVNEEGELYYQQRYNDLLKIGDYCYKQIRPLYLNYCVTYMPPHLTRFIPYKAGVPEEFAPPISHLQLVVNNV